MRGTQRSRLPEGYPAHPLPSLGDGTPLSVARFRGQKVVLHQFASW